MFAKCLNSRSSVQTRVAILLLIGILIYSLLRLKPPICMSYQHFRLLQRPGKCATNSSHSERLLFLFTSWTDNKDKSLVYQKTTATWGKLLPAAQPGMFSNETPIVNKTSVARWRVHDISERACGGVPTLRGMFLDAVRVYGHAYPLFGFSNGDILYDQSLVDTTRQVVLQLGRTFHTKPVLILGKRLNVNIHKCLSLNVSDLSVLVSSGKYPVEGSSDLFITNSRFPWKDVPALVVGRVGFGMWLVSFARARGVIVIDVTRTTRAIHMTTRAGNFESSDSVNRLCNLRLVRQLGLVPRSYRCGWIDCANHHTVNTASGVRIQHRDIPDFCHWCDTPINKPT